MVCQGPQAACRLTCMVFRSGACCPQMWHLQHRGQKPGVGSVGAEYVQRPCHAVLRSRGGGPADAVIPLRVLHPVIKLYLAGLETLLCASLVLGMPSGSALAVGQACLAAARVLQGRLGLGGQLSRSVLCGLGLAHDGWMLWEGGQRCGGRWGLRWGWGGGNTQLPATNTARRRHAGVQFCKMRSSQSTCRSGGGVRRGALVAALLVVSLCGAAVASYPAGGPLGMLIGL